MGSLLRKVGGVLKRKGGVEWERKEGEEERELVKFWEFFRETLIVCTYVPHGRAIR